MILSDTAILAAMESGDIVVEPFDRDRLGTNSYDVCLGKNLACYVDDVLDARAHNHVERFEISPEGIVLEPGKTYLGVTEEYTETRRYVPFLEGKSSVGRLGIDIHATAGFAIIGHSRFRWLNPYAFMRACPSGNSSISSWMVM